eukprot:scaffold84501_cov28-Attheya_sp.AAC.2
MLRILNDSSSLTTSQSVIELDDPVQSRYIPHYKRWTQGQQIGAYLLKQVTHLWKHCEDCLNCPSTHNENRRGKIKQLRIAYYKIESQDDLRYHRQRWSTRLTDLLAFNAVVMQAATDIRKEHSATFDTDSGGLRDSGRVVQGFGGTKTTGIKIGTLVLWKWCNNRGQEHKFKLILRSTRWGMTTKSATLGESSGRGQKAVILYWNQHKHKLTIPLSVATNVATFRTAPGYGKFDAFCAEAGFTSVDDEEPPLFPCQEANLISNDEDNNEPAIEHNPAAIRKEWGLQSPGPTIRFHPDTNIPSIPNSRERSRVNLSTPTPTLFNLDGPNTVSEEAPLPNVVIDKEDRLTETAPAELLRYHHISSAMLLSKSYRNWRNAV